MAVASEAVTRESVSNEEPRVLVDTLGFPEGPRWHNGHLYFSDMATNQVLRIDLDGRIEIVAEVEHRPSGIGWDRQGNLLVVSMLNKRLLRLGENGLTEIADLSNLAQWACNDMVVDHSGRAYIVDHPFVLDGNPTALGCIIRVDTQLDSPAPPTVAASNLNFPNGSVITPDGKTLIVAESFSNCLTSFKVHDDGSLSDREVWAVLPGKPDGICLDAEGCIWVGLIWPAEMGFVRVEKGGRIVQTIPTPGRRAVACMLGGDDGRDLFMLEADPIQVPNNEMQPGYGQIRVVTVSAPGAGLP